MIGVVDCGIGNVGSIVNMLKRISAAATVVTRAEDLAAPDKLILPGVGAFDAGMDSLEAAGILAPLRAAAQDGKPLLGICLGAQMLMRSSEEGVRPGLGLVAGDCRRFRVEPLGLKVPHIGWNHVEARKASVLFEGFAQPPRFYFVHSFHLVCEDPADVLTTTEYGQPFASSIERGSVAGVQFHPEKSHRFGMQLLRNFAERF